MGIEINYGSCILEMCKSNPTQIRSDQTRLDFEAIIFVLWTRAILMLFEKFTRASFIQIALETILIPTLQMHEINNCFKDKYLSNFFNGIDDTMRIRWA